MNPTLDEVRKIAQTGLYKRIPVCRELYADRYTPVEVMRTLRKASRHCYLLESASQTEVWGRYSFLGYEPEMEINHAIAVDLSGGGIRFMAEEEGKKGEYLFISMLLRSLDNNQLLEIAGRVLSCNRVEGDRGKKKYEYRVQFLTRDQKKREAIIKYIFEQERKNRQKG